MKNHITSYYYTAYSLIKEYVVKMLIKHSVYKMLKQETGLSKLYSGGKL